MRRRRRLTIVHKANILRRSSGLFLQVYRDVASAYPDLTMDDFHIDAMTAHLVRRGDTFDVVVAENMFGDILSDLAGELSGSLGLAGSLNAGTDHAMAQAARGSAPDIAGQGVANPIGLLLSAAMLLRWLGDKKSDPRLTAAETPSMPPWTRRSPAESEPETSEAMPARQSSRKPSSSGYSRRGAGRNRSTEAPGLVG